MAYDSRIRRDPRSTLGAVDCIQLVHVSIPLRRFPVLRTKYVYRPPGGRGAAGKRSREGESSDGALKKEETEK